METLFLLVIVPGKNVGRNYYASDDKSDVLGELVSALGRFSIKIS